MRVENLRLEQKDVKVRAAATVIWEDCEREPFELFFEAKEPYARDLSANPHAFLLACFIPAMEDGEKRLCTDEPICPVLRTGVETAMAWLHHWYGPSSTPLKIESRPGIPPWEPAERKHTASFLSGGIDSLATLRSNRLNYPLDHPCSIKDCLFVHGFDIGGTHHGGREEKTYELAFKSLQPIVADAQVELIPVYTNARLLNDDVFFWIFKFCGAAICSVAHAFSKRLSAVLVASSLTFSNMEPEGTHPLLEPNYGSAELAIFHDGTHLSRTKKVYLVADWQVALDNMRVCTMNPPGMPNCGVCEKCLRTMTALVAAGKLNQTIAFPVQDVSAELLETVHLRDLATAEYYRQLVDPLRAQGRGDLADIILRKTAALEKHLRWKEEMDWKGAVKKLDRKFLGGNLFKTYEKIYRRLPREARLPELKRIMPDKSFGGTSQREKVRKRRENRES